MPPSASAIRPSFARSAPVKAPFACPNSSLSSSVSGNAAQLSATKGPAPRVLPPWIARASTSLPVPVSPVSRTVAPLFCARSTSASVSPSAALSPTMPAGAAVRAGVGRAELGRLAAAEVGGRGPARGIVGLEHGARTRGAEALRAASRGRARVQHHAVEARERQRERVGELARPGDVHERGRRQRARFEAARGADPEHGSTGSRRTSSGSAPREQAACPARTRRVAAAAAAAPEVAERAAPRRGRTAGRRSRAARGAADGDAGVRRRGPLSARARAKGRSRAAHARSRPSGASRRRRSRRSRARRAARSAPSRRSPARPSRPRSTCRRCRRSCRPGTGARRC